MHIDNTKSCKYKFYCILVFFLCIIITVTITNGKYNKHRAKKIYGANRRITKSLTGVSKTICTHIDNTLKARHKSCFLRPDTGPCRADIIQYYYDPRQLRCYRFYWGGCQGNGNRFETRQKCLDYCYLNATSVRNEIPHFCSLSFEYGDCFGYFHRWGWDKISKSCKRYMYSGCGGNQNNFQSNIECMKTCVTPPNNTLQQYMHKYTTCMPIFIPNLQ